MNKMKKLYVLLGVLVLACGITFFVSRQEEKKEQIKNSDETIFSVDTESVTALSWEYAGNTFSFHKSGGKWIYDTDENFPVNEDKIESLLSQFTEFGASFVIEEVDDFGQYGLSDPLATISVTAGEESYEVNLGDYSTMDAERYVSIGDGKVYLVKHDPLDDYDLTISDLIQNDEIPVLTSATGIQFSGEETYTIDYEEESSHTYCAEDVYFTEEQPLDTSLVKSYLQKISALSLSDYVSYNATEEELQAYGLAEPELSVTVDYPMTHSDDVTTTETFVLHVGRDAAEKAQAAADDTTVAAGTDAEDGLTTAAATGADAEDGLTTTAAGEAAASDEDTAAEVTAYVRVGDSQIIYRITSEEYRALTAASYNDLRHKEVLTASMEDITGLTFTMDGETYVLHNGAAGTTEDGETAADGTASAETENGTEDGAASTETENGTGDGAASTDAKKDTGDGTASADAVEGWFYRGTEIDVTDLETALGALSADSFTEETPTGKEEIRFTAYLSNANFPKVEVVLYRYDGEYCLATVDGRTVSLVPRSQAVALMEAVNAIVLN